MKAKPNFHPYAHQLEGVKQIEEWGIRGLIADEQGVGKSGQALMLIIRNPETIPALVICPAHLKYNWAKMAKEQFSIEADILEKTKGCWRDWDVGNPPHLSIVNYDILQAWLPYLRYLKPRLVITDEAQALANPRSQRTRAHRELLRAAEVPHFVPMSGTPIMNRPIEFWSVLNMISPKDFPNYYGFGQRYCAGRRNRFGGWDFRGASRLDELHEKLKGVMIRRLKKDVLQNLPDKVTNVVPIPLTSVREYQKAERDFTTWLRENYNVAQVTRAMRCEALTKAAYLKQLTTRLKMPAVMEWVDNFLEGGQKLIVFGIHRKTVMAFQEKYGKEFCATVTGDITGKNRQVEFDRFNEDDRCRLLSGNLKAAGSGWSANACSDVAFIEMAWNPATHAQGIDRCHGINRGVEGRSTTAHWLLARETIEESNCRLLISKAKNIDAVMDGGEVEDMSTFDMFLKGLLEK